MKVIVTTLAFVLITGTQGAVLWRNEPQKRLDNLKNSLQNYFSQVSDKARDTIEHIDNSEFGKQLNLTISESLEKLNGYVTELQRIVSPLSDEIRERLQKDRLQLEEKIQMDLKEFKVKILQYTSDLRNKVNLSVETSQFMLEPLANSIQEQVIQNAKILHQSLTPLAEEIKAKIQSNMKDFKMNIAPFTETVRKRLDAHPLTSKLSEKFDQKLEEMRQTFTPVVENFQKYLTPYTKDLKNKLTSLWDRLYQNINEGY
ncbi:apolipoprotein A-I-like [Stegostoma tigrinum]|uniref:apolipoprotein A-I-like n=1 Tax=Stegostoma tigrinum TaxID=3053191 RepID=UPI00202B0B13|nr:apolipoprotein A-I-like [Stegostoma tigrinum]